MDGLRFSEMASDSEEMSIDTTFSAELAQLEELETELTRMHKDRSDSDSIHSQAESTTSTHSIGSSNSSPLNGNGGTTAATSDNQTPRASAASTRFGVTRPILARRAHSTLELGRVSTSSTGSNDSATRKMSSTEARKAYAQSVKARMSENGNVDDGMRMATTRARSGSGSSNGSSSNMYRSSSIPPPTPVPELITPSLLLTPQRPRRDSVASSTSSVSSISSIQSATSTVSARTANTTMSRYNRTRSMASGTSYSSSSYTTSVTASMSSTTTKASARSSPGKTASSASVIPPPRVSVMQKLLQASSADAKDTRIDSDLVKQLKQQYVMAEQAVQSLLKPSTSTSSTMLPSSSPLRGAETEVRRLKNGIKTLSEHSVALMLACEVLTRQQDEHLDELAQVKVMNDQLLGEVESLSVAAASAADHSTPPSNADFSGSDNANPPTLERRLSAESSLSVFVNEMLRTATEKIEDKWKARFAEKLAEHEHALEVERERASASILSNSRLVTETKHEKEDELKALNEQNVALQLTNKQLSIETAALQQDLDFLKSQLDVQDEIRNSSSFWEKTTDLAKRNRALTEELAGEKQTVKKLTEVVSDLRTQNITIRQENDRIIRHVKDFETEKQVLEDQLVEAAAKVEDEKTRREQFQVNVEQLTVENTALYAQMVALQATHEAKMEEARANFEKRNAIVAGEMRALQAQNQLMRGSDHGGYAASRRSPLTASSSSSAPSTGSSTGGGLSPEAQRELDSRLQQVTDELLTVRQELLVRTDQIAELEKQVAEGEVLRRKLHNTIQELRGNIRVHVRLRPFLRSDGHEALADAPQPAIRCDTFAGTLVTNVEKQHTFAFDKVYGQSESQDAVFGDVSDFIQSAMDGYNVCIFAYGQTGSGKTHTMQGSGKAQMRGIIPRALQLIINTCRSLSTQGWQYALDVTFYEIYNETIRDLLGPSAAFSDDDRKFPIRTDKRGKNYVEGLTTVPIDFEIAELQMDEIVQVAACNRSVDKTDMNAHSSRSHSIFGLSIRGVNEAQNTEVEGTLSLVDLAGSERLSRSNATGDRLKEAQAINKSLSALADVFQALAKKAAHVPYRNSKLTYALQPALSGDGKTLMMVNLSPTFASVDESVCSLRFAQNVSQCELGAPTRQIKSRAVAAAPSSGSGVGAMASVRSSPARGLSGSAVMTPTGTPTASVNTSTPTRPRSLTASTATPPIAKKLQF